MLERITSGWTITRIIYLVLGAAMAWQSAAEKQWFGIFLGGYFAAMGLFAFGCAGGNCFPVSNRFENDGAAKDISYEEVK